MMNEIEKMLLEMKDTSELMVDLAYSSLLYNNAEIAEEVISMEAKMDEISSMIQEKIVNLGKEDPEQIVKFPVILRLQTTTEDIANAAASIADVVLRGLSDHPVIQMSIQESDVTIVKATVSEKSILAGKTIGEMRFGSVTGMYFIVIKRGNQYIYDPHKHTTINVGDMLIARGPNESVDHFLNLAKGEDTEL